MRRALGGSRYAADIALGESAWVCYARSRQAHAMVEVDLSAALGAPGVIAAFDGPALGSAERSHPLREPCPPLVPAHPAMARPWLGSPRVRFEGEAVAVVVADTAAHAADAAALVGASYKSLPAVVDPELSLSDDVLVFEDAGTNTVASWPADDDPNFFAGCEVVVSQRILNQRVAHCALEPRAVAAEWNEEGLVEMHCSTQNPAALRSVLSFVLGVEEEAVRIVSVDMGGAFGSKINPYPEELLVAWLAREVGWPLRWCETRSETMVAGGHGRAQVQYVELGGSKDGRLSAYRLQVVQDCGAYPADAVTLPGLSRTMAPGPYEIPKVSFGAKAVLTNTAPVRAFRGSGRPEATAALERAVDLFAAEIGMSPLLLRQKNLIAAEKMPWTTPMGATYDGGDYRAALDRLVSASGYFSIREDQQLRRVERHVRQVGIGLALYCEVTNAVGGRERAEAWVNGPGRVAVSVGTAPSGQGHAYALAWLVAKELNLDISAIDVITGDTGLCPAGGGTFGSRSLQAAGPAAVDAARALLRLAAEEAGRVLEVDCESLEQRGTSYLDPRSDRAVLWEDLGSPGPLRTLATTSRSAPTFSFGAHLAVVEVDVETFEVALMRYVALDDAGRIIDPIRSEGQIHGAILQGVAQALWEELSYGPEGSAVETSFRDYLIPSASDVPLFETLRSETPTDRNILGVRGVGESGSIASSVAVQNAVIDALGVRHVDMPLRPERLWRAVGRDLVHP